MATVAMRLAVRIALRVSERAETGVCTADVWNVVVNHAHLVKSLVNGSVSIINVPCCALNNVTDQDVMNRAQKRWGVVILASVYVVRHVQKDAEYVTKMRLPPSSLAQKKTLRQGLFS